MIALNNSYFLFFRRWAWLMALLMLVTAATAFLLSRSEPVQYEAKARLIVGPGVDSLNPDLDALRTGGQLMQTYTRLATTRPLIEAVIKELKLQTIPVELLKQITVNPDVEAQIVTIRTVDTDPERAVLITNSLADQLVALSPDGTDGTVNEQRSSRWMIRQFIEDTNERIRTLEQQLQDEMVRPADPVIQSVIDNTETRIDQLGVSLPTTAPDQQGTILDQIATERKRLYDLQAMERESQQTLVDEISQERNRLFEAQRTMAQLDSDLENSFTNQVKIIERAEAVPAGSQLPYKVGGGALAGAILGLLFALGYEYFRPTGQKQASEATALASPVVGTALLPLHAARPGEERLLVQQLPINPSEEDYRRLGATLFPGEESGKGMLHSVLLSSARPDEDISEIVAGFAVTLAELGHEVILVDANLRHPYMASLFEIENRRGLHEILLDPEAAIPLVPVRWAPGLSLLPAGTPTPNPVNLFASSQVGALISQLERQADIVLVAGLPLLSSPESLLLVPYVDGVVLLDRSLATVPAAA